MAKAKIYLYKEGNECKSLTGGWGNDFDLTSDKSRENLVKNSNHMILRKTKQNGELRSGTSQKIDLSNMSKICCHLDVVTANNNTSVWHNFSIQTDKTITTTNVTKFDKNGKQIYEMEVDSYADSYYVKLSYADTSSNTSVTGSYIYNMYLETKENILTINSQENENITFNTSDLGLVTINKIDVLVNGVVSKTYTDNYSNLSYTVDKSLCYIGNNNIEIRVTYSQGDDITETVSEYLTYKYDVSQLPQETPLLDTVERVKLLTELKQTEKDTLSNILTSKNVEVTEEDKMSDLIGKVDMLGEYDNPILYLYKDGDECASITGGWEDGYVYGSGTSLTKGDDYIETRVTVATNTRREVRTVKTIDFTKYSKLCFYGDFKSRTDNDYKSQYFLISNSTNYSSGWGGGASSPLFKENIRLDGNLTHVIDISSINSVSRLFWGVDSGRPTPNYSKVYKIWLEK